MVRASHRLPVLDALRMVAALWVFLAHAAFAENYFRTGDTVPLDPTATTGLREIVRTGWMGVDLFFVISGIVITRTAVGRSAAEFIVARFSRIAPSFLVGVTIAILITFFLGGQGTTPYNGFATIPDLLPSFTLLNYPLGSEVTAEPSYWTLWTEAKFYALVALCLLVCRVGTRRTIIIFLTLWLFAVILLHEGPQPTLTALLLTPFAPYFILGAVLGMVRNRRELLLLSPLLLASVVMAAAAAEARGAFATGTSTACVVVLSAAVVAGLLVKGSDSRLSRTATALGLASFPLYLLNYRFGGLIVGALQSRGVGIGVALVVGSAVLVTVAYLWASRVEPHLQRRLKDAMVAGLCEFRPEPRPVTGAPAATVPDEPRRTVPADETMPVPAVRAPHHDRAQGHGDAPSRPEDRTRLAAHSAP
ncbi:MAG: acyltransferase [Blastococcus sp.]|nr:acyltransferase [Blastococcus sp.]